MALRSAPASPCPSTMTQMYGRPLISATESALHSTSWTSASMWIFRDRATALYGEPVGIIDFEALLRFDHEQPIDAIRPGE